MKTFNKHLNDKLKDKEFKQLFNEEKKLLELSLKIHQVRERKGFSQLDVAEKAHITQQQLSKLESGINCNMITFLKVCNALGLEISFMENKYKKTVA